MEAASDAGTLKRLGGGMLLVAISAAIQCNRETVYLLAQVHETRHLILQITSCQNPIKRNDEKAQRTSAISISLRPNAASEMSVTMFSDKRDEFTIAHVPATL